MATVLTLHPGGSRPKVPDGFIEHPTETARWALMAAAEVEGPHMARALRRVADALPKRAPVRKTAD